jgi:phage baseplate assembly protein W
MGFGISPVGGFPVGFGEVTSASAPPPLSQCSRYINPYTRDYEMGTYGSFKRMTPIHQRVQLTLSTLQGSSAVMQSWGVSKPPKISASFAADADARIREALSVMTDVEKVLRVDNVTVETANRRSKVTVSFTDLTTNTQAQASINLG